MTRVSRRMVPASLQQRTNHNWSRLFFIGTRWWSLLLLVQCIAVVTDNHAGPGCRMLDLPYNSGNPGDPRLRLTVYSANQHQSWSIITEGTGSRAIVRRSKSTRGVVSWRKVCSMPVWRYYPCMYKTCRLITKHKGRTESTNLREKGGRTLENHDGHSFGRVASHQEFQRNS